MENNHTLGHRLPHEQHSQTHTHKQLFSDLHPSVQPPEINTLIDNSCMHRSRHPHRYLKNVPAACTHARSCTRTHACSPHLLLVLCPRHPLTLLQGCQYSLLVSEDFLSSWPPPPPLTSDGPRCTPPMGPCLRQAHSCWKGSTSQA